MTFEVKFRLRIYRGDEIAIGPGKIALVEAIAETGSISAAARRLGMSYRRAWLLVAELNRSLRIPAVIGVAGGRHGGGATLTDEGRELVRRYRRIETTARDAAAGDLDAMTRLLAP